MAAVAFDDNGAATLVCPRRHDYVRPMNDESPAFLKGNPWRILHVIAELVVPFGTLSRVNPTVIVLIRG
jgi:hypothetical protein